MEIKIRATGEQLKELTKTLDWKTLEPPPGAAEGEKYLGRWGNEMTVTLSPRSSHSIEIDGEDATAVKHEAERIRQAAKEAGAEIV